MAQKVATYGPELMRMEKSLLLQILDHLWKDHLLNLDHLRQGIHLRGYGQRDPLNEYKREAFDLFEGMLTNLRQTVTQVITHLEVRTQPQQVAAEEAEAGRSRRPVLTGARSDLSVRRRRNARCLPRAARRPAQAAEGWGKVGRNTPCPCGSGRKYKHCHGRLH